MAVAAAVGSELPQAAAVAVAGAVTVAEGAAAAVSVASLAVGEGTHGPAVAGRVVSAAEAAV